MGLFGYFFSRLSFLFSFSLSLGDGPIKTEILSQRAVNPETTSQQSLKWFCLVMEIEYDLISYCALDPRCWSLHLEWTNLLIMFYLSVKFAEIHFSYICSYTKNLMSDN